MKTRVEITLRNRFFRSHITPITIWPVQSQNINIIVSGQTTAVCFEPTPPSPKLDEFTMKQTGIPSPVVGFSNQNTAWRGRCWATNYTDYHGRNLPFVRVPTSVSVCLIRQVEWTKRIMGKLSANFVKVFFTLSPPTTTDDRNVQNIHGIIDKLQV